MCEIIIDDGQEQDYNDHKSETTKFFERDYQDIILLKSKIKEKLKL